MDVCVAKSDYGYREYILNITEYKIMVIFVCYFIYGSFRSRIL